MGWEGHSPREIERLTRWLMTLRGVTVTTLLICAFGVEQLLRPGVTLRPLFFLAAGAYATVLVYALANRWLSGRPEFVALQLVGDALLVTLFVRITGGVDSPMSFLYLLPISVASLVLYRRGGLAMALGCWLLYGAFVLAPAGMAADGFAPAEPGRIAYLALAHLVALAAFGALSSHLSERLRAQGRELDERRGAVVRLKALNENIIESLNSGLITTDLEGRINFLNRGGAEILRRAPSDLDGRSIAELLQLGEEQADDIRRRLLANRRFRFERFHETPDGRRIFLGIAVSNLNDRQGRPLGYIFVFQDLTEIRALEDDMRLKERMVALGEMAAGMAHELRNPLAAISGAVQYLKDGLPPGGETRELMEIILRESQRLDQTIRDFLTFARPGGYAPAPLDLVRLIEDQAKLLRKSRECTSRHRVEVHAPEGGLTVDADGNRLKQVFWNLATNALKAMPEGGCLRIEVRAQGAEQVEVRFEDDGLGMDEATLARYFQPFSGTFPDGTGLGAAIVYRLVAEHGGAVHVDSTPGRGTRVRIELPRRAEAPTPGPEPRLAAVGG
jgi:two-component system, NtrC family, sensor histidine kinase PilS